jgi:hypothetical protein
LIDPPHVSPANVRHWTKQTIDLPNDAPVYAPISDWIILGLIVGFIAVKSSIGRAAVFGLNIAPGIIDALIGWISV